MVAEVEGEKVGDVVEGGCKGGGSPQSAPLVLPSLVVVGGESDVVRGADVDVEEAVSRGVVGSALPTGATLPVGACRGRSQTWPASASRAGVGEEVEDDVELVVVEVSKVTGTVGDGGPGWIDCSSLG